MEERQHIPLHRGGLVLKAPLQELKSKKAPLWGVLHQKSPPCVKGEVDAVDGRIVLVQPLCHGCAVPPPPASPAELRHRGGFIYW